MLVLCFLAQFSPVRAVLCALLALTGFAMLFPVLGWSTTMMLRP